MTPTLAALRQALPALEWGEAAPRPLPPLPAPGAPLGPLRRAVARAARPLLLVNDRSRVLPRDLAGLLQDLWEKAGGRARLVVATGSHAGNAASYRDLLGGLPAEVHDADDPGAHARLEAWRVDRRLLEADLVLAVGSVEPHYFAGWTGAHKTATVGLWERGTIARNHRLALEPAALPTRLEGNPVFDDLAAAAAALERGRRLLVLNQVLDAEGVPLAAATGTWRGALRRCLAAAEARWLHEVAAPVDVVVARVAGPLGRSLYQADKGVKNQEQAVRDGGDLLLLADLSEGLGPARFLELLEQAPDLAAARERVAREGYRLGDHKAVRWRALEARGVRVRLVAPGLDPEALARTGLEVHPALESALAALRAEGRGGAGRGLFVPEAGLTVVRPA